MSTQYLKTIKNAILVALALCFASSCENGPSGLGLTPRSVDLPAKGGTAQIAFSAAQDWTANASADWVTLSPASGQAGDIIVTLTVAENTSTTPRTATVTVTEPSIGMSDAITVSQEGAEVIPDPVLQLSAHETSLGAGGGSAQLTVQTNREWTATPDSDWIVATPDKGIAGNITVTLTVAENPDTQPRTGTVTFKADNLTEIFTISQYAQKPAAISLSSDAFVFGAEGGMNTLKVTANVDWNASTEDNWLEITPTEGISGTSAVVVEAAAHEGTESRTGKIVFSGGGVSTVLMVTQMAPVSPETPTLELSASTLTFTEEAGNNEISVISNQNWSASSDSNWIQVAPASGASGTVTVKITVTANNSESDRGGKVTFTAGDLVRTLIVNQKGKTPETAPSINLAPVSLTYSADGGTATVTVNADAAWKAAAEADWITLSTNSGQAGNSSIRVTAAANKSTNDRTVAVVFTAGVTSVRLSISQKGLTQQQLGGITGDLGDWADGGSSNFHKNN